MRNSVFDGLIERRFEKTRHKHNSSRAEKQVETVVILFGWK